MNDAHPAPRVEFLLRKVSENSFTLFRARVAVKNRGPLFWEMLALATAWRAAHCCIQSADITQGKIGRHCEPIRSLSVWVVMAKIFMSSLPKLAFCRHSLRASCTSSLASSP